MNNYSLNQEDFKNLKKGSKVKDRSEETWIVRIANCGGPEKHPIHLFERPSGYFEFIFHDGKHTRILDEGEKRNGALCVAFCSKF